MGPQWKTKPITTVYPAKSKVNLFYRDPIQCMQSLMHSPLVNDFISFDQLHIFRTAAKLTQVYTEWLSGDASWTMQVHDLELF